MKRSWTLLPVLLLLALGAACTQESGPSLTYPETRKVDQVDDYFGTKVADPYRWMENEGDPDLRAWIDAQNKVTFGYLDQIPFRDQIRQRLEQVYDYPKYGLPERVGKYYFFTKNDGLQNQSVIYIREGLTGEPEVFLDPNKMSAEGTTRVRLLDASIDDRYIAYSISEGGSDWLEVRVIEIDTRQELPDRIRWAKFTGVAWHDGGFFYSGFDQPEPGKELVAKNEYQKIFYHTLGQPQAEDRLVYEDREHPLRYKNVDVTEDGRWLILSVSEGTHGNELHVRDLTRAGSEFQPLITGFEYDSNVLDSVGDGLLILTNMDAPNQRIVRVDPDRPAPDNWTVVVPEKPETITYAGTAAGQLFVHYLKDATSRVFQFELDGTPVREVVFPAPGSVYGFGGHPDDDVLFYQFASFTTPPTIYRFDPRTGEAAVYQETEVNFDPGLFETRQVFYTSRDGTRVPMFLVHKRGLALDGDHPTYLYGYGGFQASITPRFDSTLVVLLENDGVYAVANLRGGGEYGEEWHRAGMRLKKQNVFDDFIAAAEYLIREKYTSARRLAIAGGSNGGLLVGACMTQRPELFQVALPAVGVMDMLRYHKFTVGWGWVPEYGSSEDEENFRNLYAYSPLHNIEAGVEYPATLVTTADHDDRVVPAHSFKFIATLQEKQAGDNPVLIRIETMSGHGASSTAKRIAETTDEWAFLFYNMGVTPKYQ